MIPTPTGCKRKTSDAARARRCRGCCWPCHWRHKMAVQAGRPQVGISR
jgi:hypothetical protein